MINIKEKIKSIVEERAMTLSSKTTLEQNKILAISERDFLYKYVTNSSVSDFGVLDLLALMAKELACWENVTFNKPNLLQTQSNYSSSLNNKLNAAVGINGDGDIFVNSSAQEININSHWISGNGYNSTGFNSDLESNMLDLTSSVNSLISIRSQIDQEDEFSSIYTDPILVAINSLISKINNANTNFTTILENAINNINSNIYLNEPDISADIDNNLLGFKAILTSYQSTLISAKNTFNVYDKEVIDSTLVTLSLIQNNLTTDINSRRQTLKNTINGDVNSGLRKWYLFWLEVLIGKPQSSYRSASGLTSALTSNINDLAKKKRQLDSLFNGNVEKYLPRPEISAVFRNEENKIVILISSLPCFSKIILYRKEILEVNNLSNVDYTTVLFSKELPETNLVLLDDSVIENDKLYSYRIKIQDSGSYRKDAFDSGSDQSLVFDLENPQDFTVAINSNVLNLPENQLSANQYIYIENEGVFLIIERTSMTITLNRPVVSSGILYLVNGLFHS